MHNHIRAQRQWLLEIRRHKSVVHYQRNFLVAADLADGCKVAQSHQRIRRSLDVHHARVFADGTLHVARIGSVDIRKLQPKSSHDLVEQTRRSPI